MYKQVLKYNPTGINQYSKGMGGGGKGGSGGGGMGGAAKLSWSGKGSPVKNLVKEVLPGAEEWSEEGSDSASKQYPTRAAARSDYAKVGASLSSIGYTKGAKRKGIDGNGESQDFDHETAPTVRATLLSGGQPGDHSLSVETVPKKAKKTDYWKEVLGV